MGPHSFVGGCLYSKIRDPIEIPVWVLFLGPITGSLFVILFMLRETDTRALGP